MISIYQKKKIISFLLASFFVLLTFPHVGVAQGISMSVTPTLFEMSATPKQAWNSSIKVINNNQQELVVYANVVNFAPQGETGHGKFLPVFENFTEGKTLAEWITVPETAFVIPQESSVKIPIQVNVPEDAAPGGHFAAIMIGTKPPASAGKQQVTTSQVVTSLFFVRIAGDVVENGTVRTFKATDSIVAVPEVDFEVRFENKGNVHLQPQGQILITNMWGKERGVVPINYQTNFGNVLPESIRKFTFSWKGERSFLDIGRYKAQLTLAYGTDARQFSTQATFFWIIPVKPVLSVLGIFLLIALLISWSTRTYVKRMLLTSGIQGGYVLPSQRLVQEGDVVVVHKVAAVTAPLRVGVDDLKQQLSTVHTFKDTVAMLLHFAYAYRAFFISVSLLLCAGLAISFFWNDVTTEQRDYEITIDKQDTDITVSSEEILYEKTNTVISESSTEIFLPVNEEQEFEIILINSSDTPGVAASLKAALEIKGYQIASLKSDFSESKDRTVIVYDVSLQEEALELSKILGGVLLSARPEDSEDAISGISIFIGNEYIAQ